MTQPSFVPITEADQVRPALRLHVPGAWAPDRPAELHIPTRPGRSRMGTPGPDQGFALRLAHRFTGDLQLADGESAEDVVVGCALLASRRAGLFGRAPSVHDVRAALVLWGYLDQAAPGELVAARRETFLGAAHDYDVQRRLVDGVPDATFRLAPDQVTARVAAGGWRALVGASAGGPAA